MKLTKLSLVAALAVSSAFAGGDIAPVEPVVEAPVVEAADCNKDTTISGKAVAYYYTFETAQNLFDKTNSQLGTSVTLDVSHKLIDGITANFSAMGYVNLGNTAAGYMEQSETGAFFNVANLTATFGDTTLVLGRQLLDTPMLGGFDWLLAPGSFEAATIVNQSVSDLTLIASYVNKWRANNSGSTFEKLTDNNFAFGASYSNGLDANVWFYNVDHADYTQIYADAGYNFGGFNLAGQVVSTNYDTGTDSMAYGAKVGTEVSGINLTAAVNMVSDAATGYVGRDGLYTSTWNNNASTKFVANDDTISWKVGASTTLAGADLSAAYAGFGDEGSELDLIAGYDVTDAVNLGAVYSLTDNDINVNTQDAASAIEVFATYKF